MQATRRGASTEAEPNGTTWRSPRSVRYEYDPAGEVRVERLRLARHWYQEGATQQAIAAYTDMMVRYAGMPAAAAAAEELLAMALFLEQQGKFYAVLDIFRKVERSC